MLIFSFFLTSESQVKKGVGSSGGGSGTVTNVSSANSDASVANPTTTPVITINTGTTANKIVKLDGSAKLPAVDGSQLTGLSAGDAMTRQAILDSFRTVSGVGGLSFTEMNDEFENDSSTAFGLSAVVLKRAVAFGGNAFAGDSSVAVGARIAVGNRAIGIGNKTVITGDHSVSIGVTGGIEGYEGVGIGYGVSSASTRITAVGSTTAVDGDSGTAIGYHAYVAVANGTALGAGSDVEHNHSTALGAGSATTSSNQIMLGSSSDTVVVPLYLKVDGNTSVAGTIANQYGLVHPYKVYVALLSQSGTDAPTAIVLQNTLGVTPVWARVGSGNFTFTSVGLFLQTKTWISPSAFSQDDASNTVVFFRNSDDELYLIATGGDSNLSFHPVEIRVYP